ncbi:MAG: hypothetical protein MUC74_08545 [Ideonella sp.]|nr:hypothetical protein [Ideonella sp.]
MTHDARDSPWSDSTPPVSTPLAAGGWFSPGGLADPATRMVRDEEDYLDNENRDVGRRLSESEHELFVSCDAAQALHQQFEHLRPEYIALHDIGAPMSRRLLAGVAAASQRKLQRLTIRRQGQGAPLARLEFLELNAADGRIVRLYTTETEADPSSRRLLVRTLLCFARLGVVLVGDLPPYELDRALRPLQDEITVPPWHNRHLLLLPLASAGPLAALGAELGRRTGVQVLVTPLVARPSEAWQYIVNSYGRLKTDGTLSPNRRQADLFGSTAAAAPLAMRPMPSTAGTPPAPLPAEGGAGAHGVSSGVGTAAARPAPVIRPRPAEPTGHEETIPAAFAMQQMPAVSNLAPLSDTDDPSMTGLLRRYMDRVAGITGMVSCAVFEVSTGRDLLHLGARPTGDSLARHGSALVSAILDASRGLGLGAALPDAAVSLGAHHLIVRPLPRHPGLALHAVLDKHQSNLVLARLQLLRFDAEIDET